MICPGPSPFLPPVHSGIRFCPRLSFTQPLFRSERRFYVFYSAKLRRASIFSQGDIILQCFRGPDSFV